MNDEFDLKLENLEDTIFQTATISGMTLDDGRLSLVVHGWTKHDHDRFIRLRLSKDETITLIETLNVALRDMW